MSAWFLYDQSGQHRGPVEMDELLRAIRAGELRADAFVAPEHWFEPPGGANGAEWKRIGDIPEIMDAIQRMTDLTQSVELRIFEGGFTATRQGAPEFGKTMMIVANKKT